MELTPETTVQELLLENLATSAFHTLKDAMKEVETAGSVRGIDCFSYECECFLGALSGNDSEKKRELIAALLPPWFFEIKKILKEHE